MFLTIRERLLRKPAAGKHKQHRLHDVFTRFQFLGVGEGVGEGVGVVVGFGVGVTVGLGVGVRVGFGVGVGWDVRAMMAISFGASREIVRISGSRLKST